VRKAETLFVILATYLNIAAEIVINYLGKTTYAAHPKA
jgi:hypothetical protein